MNRFGFQWPDSLDCARFPADTATSLCVGENRTGVDEGRRQAVDDGDQTFVNQVVTPKPEVNDRIPPTLPSSKLRCPTRLRVPESLGYRIELSDQTVGDCGLPCSVGDLANSLSQRSSAVPRDGTSASRTVILLAAAICLASTLFTIVTFLIDRARFRYPERSLIFFAVCYSFISAAYLVGPASGRELVSCVGRFNGTGRDAAAVGVAIVAQGTKNELCTAVFAVIYFFTMAASIWWVVDMPVDKIKGRPVERRCLSRAWSVNEAEGIL